MKRNKLMTNYFPSLVIVIVVVVVFIGCKQSIIETKNYIWKATKGQNTVYLVGTMHLMPKGYKLISDKLDSIIDETEGIAVEYNAIDNNNISKVQKESQKRVILENGDIEKLLSGSEIDKLKSILGDYGINYEQVKRYSPLGILSAIDQAVWTISKTDSPGLDAALLNRYQKDRKKIEELEGVDFQLDLIDKIYTVETLKQYIKIYHEGSSTEEIDEFNKTFEAYVNADLESLEKLGEQTNTYLYLENNYNITIKDRNINMTKKIDELAGSGKIYLVAVGAFHYPGEDGIIRGLEEMGYNVEFVK